MVIYEDEQVMEFASKIEDWNTWPCGFRAPDSHFIFDEDVVIVPIPKNAPFDEKVDILMYFVDELSFNGKNCEVFTQSDIHFYPTGNDNVDNILYYWNGRGVDCPEGLSYSLRIRKIGLGSEKYYEIVWDTMDEDGFVTEISSVIAGDSPVIKMVAEMLVGSGEVIDSRGEYIIMPE